MDLHVLNLKKNKEYRIEAFEQMPSQFEHQYPLLLILLFVQNCGKTCVCAHHLHEIKSSELGLSI